MAEVAKLERDALFKRLRAKPENKVRVHSGCLSWTYGILYLVLLTGIGAHALPERESVQRVYPSMLPNTFPLSVALRLYLPCSEGHREQGPFLSFSERTCGSHNLRVPSVRRPYAADFHVALCSEAVKICLQRVVSGLYDVLKPHAGLF